MMGSIIDNIGSFSILLILFTFVTPSFSLNEGFIALNNAAHPAFLRKPPSKNVPFIFNIKPEDMNALQSQPISLSRKTILSSTTPTDLSTASSLKVSRSLPLPKLPLLPLPLLPKVLLPPSLIPSLLPPTCKAPLLKRNLKHVARLRKSKSFTNKKNNIIKKLRELKNKGSLTTAEYLRFKKLLLG